MLVGKDKGKTGKVLKVVESERKVVIEGLNLIKKHRKPRKEGEKGQRIEIPRAVDISNVRLVCSRCGKVTGISYKKTGDKKFRICKKCKVEI